MQSLFASGPPSWLWFRLFHSSDGDIYFLMSGNIYNNILVMFESYLVAQL